MKSEEDEIMQFPIGTVFLHIFNPLSPEKSSYLGVTTSELKTTEYVAACYEMQWISSNSPHADFYSNTNLVIKHEELARGVKNYNEMIESYDARTKNR